jgi:hypothetical protein
MLYFALLYYHFVLNSLGVPSYASIFLQEELLLEHFSDLIKFVKIHPGNLRSVLKCGILLLYFQTTSHICANFISGRHSF